MNRIASHSALLPVFASLLLAACGTSGGEAPSAQSNAPSSAQLTGTVHGGQSPVSGSSITLYAAGSGNAKATVLGSTTTDGNGNWSIASFTCISASTETYLVASGGNPGLAAGTNNNALHLLAALGPCGSLVGSVNINEVTTVAAAYALGGFVSAADEDNILSISSSAVGLTNAMSTAALLANPATGGAGSAVNYTFAGCYETGGVQPPNCGAAENLNSLANALAACVNSSSGSSSQCTELFACAMPGASYSSGTCSSGSGTAPADTLQAVLNIARNPGLVSMAGIYNVATPNAEFSPALMGAPYDWTISLSFSASSIVSPSGIAIDAGGNIWIPDIYGNSLNEFGPTGNTVSPASGYTGGGLNYPDALAIDASGNLWVANSSGYSGKSISEFSPTGTAISPTAGYIGGGLSSPMSIAIDPGGNVWTANYGGNSLSEFNSSGIALSPAAGITGGGLGNPVGIAIDSNSHVWVTNSTTSAGYVGNDISEFNAAGTALSPSTGYTGGGLSDPSEIAIDISGNIWVSNNDGTVSTEGIQLSEFNSSGSALSPAAGYTAGGVAGGGAVAVDAAGNVWHPDGGALSELDSSGNPRSPNRGTGASTYGGGFTSGGMTYCYAIAIDPSGNVWGVNNGYAHNAPTSLVEFIGAAAPTTTPLISAITNGFAPQPPVQNQ
jgi:hypothetical protein